MSRINPGGQITRAERLVIVIAVIGAVLVHLVALFGWGRIYQWAQEEEKKERLMVIRRISNFTPPSETIPAPPRRTAVPAEGEIGEKSARPPPPDPKVKEEGPEPPREKELSPAMEQELQEDELEKRALPEYGENTVSVVTDLPAASFVVRGSSEYRGSGTFWVRKGAPPGVYTVTFNPVAGFSTPPVQSKELATKGNISFLGKYRRSTEVVVESNRPDARFTLYRPDGRPLAMNRPGRALLDDLPLGIYTVVFTDIPGFVTPAPLSRALSPGGKLAFFGEYRQGTAGRGTGDAAARADAAARTAAGNEIASRGRKPSAPAPRGAGLDRRVQIIVKSYPPTEIEEYHDAILYPEVVIHKSNFQQGWCQVYLVLAVDSSGEVVRVVVERPQAEDRPRFELLIKAVEESVRAWDYDRVRAEVHVDVRFYVE